MTHLFYKQAIASLVIVCAISLSAASASTFQDELVQAPSIGTPQRGSLAGTLSKLAFGPGDVARGTYTLPSPITLPEDRGPMLANVIPSYSPETGITEWGMGWQAELKIQRFQPNGEVDFVHDEFTSPWGQLVRGDDGNYYPRGLSSVLRVTADSGGWIAQTGDGTRYHFDRGDSVTTARGTFAWMLSRVDTLLGDATTLVWTRNASRRLFLTSVRWGGRGDGTQYQLSFTYEAVERPFLSYASGEPQALDQRITRLTVGVKQGAGYATRWTYDLAYLASPSGPAFYLRQVTKRYASGEAEPPITYDYDLNTELWAQTQLVHTASLDEFIATNGTLAIQPDRAALLDLEEDGLLDLETAFDQTTVHQTATGYRIEPLPAASAATDPSCRPDPSEFNKPRRLARMHGGAVEPQVVVLESFDFGSSTRVLICDRLGVPIFDHNVNDDWRLGANTRLADIDLDKRPDLVRVGVGEVTVLHNTSRGPQDLSFEPGPVTALSPEVLPIASWILDVNGDGRADLMVKHLNGVMVWLGRGGGVFESEAQIFEFITEFGEPLAGLRSYQFSPGDFNGDGLEDLLLTLNQTVLMFLNTGTEFRQIPIPALENISWTVRYPVIADLAGTGNEAAIFVDDEDQAQSIQLTSPSTGLLRSADDGKGTVVRFQYGRAFGFPGLVRRYATLVGLTVESSGYDAVNYRYEYGTPVLHSLGKYLVGFTTVDKRSPVLTERISFLNSDDFSGVHSGAADTDERSPGVIRFQRRQYDDVRFHSVRWLRPALIETGYRSPDGATVLSTTTQYALYERNFCPTVVVDRTPSGVLLTTKTLTSVPALPDDLHCLAQGQMLHGTHSDMALDFTYLANVTRNVLGQIIRVTQIDPAGSTLVLQDVTYSNDHRITAISIPGRGTTQMDYDTVGRLTSVTDPAGVITRADMVDSMTDALHALQTFRPGAPSTVFFDYDGRERLRASWDDVSGGNQVLPLIAYAYQDATNKVPGRIDTQMLADAVGGIARRTVDIIAADGEPMLSGMWLGERVAFGTAAVRTRNTLTERRSFIGTMDGQTLATMTSDDLRSRGTPLMETVHAGFGRATQTTTTQQAGVVGVVTTECILTGNELITRAHEPGGFTSESAVDAAGKLVRKIDENGVVHRYRFDALGRLVRLDTPDGVHTVSFDSFGRPALVARDGVGAIRYAYNASTGFLAQKQRVDVVGAVVDTSQTRYDAIGRPMQITRTNGTTQNGDQDAANLAFDYDGQLDGDTVGGQLGRTTRVRGDGWARSEFFDSLGRVYHRHLSIAGWRDITTDTTYHADGSAASDTLIVTDSSGRQVFASTKETELDSSGRVATIKIDGAALYTLSYDAEGRLARADFASGEAITFDYDPVTHARVGHVLDAAEVDGGVHWDRDARGLVRREIYGHGATVTHRDYDYDGRGELIRATTGNDITGYTYTTSGLPDSISDVLGTRSVRHTTNTQTVSGLTYRWDSAGRIVGKGDWAFDYGAHGQLARARSTSRQIDYVYDDADHRLIKRVDGVAVRADVAGGVLTETHFVELVMIGGIVAGVLDNGKFSALLADPRGTPLAGPDGTLGLASPYGVRASHLSYAEVIDYARLGWDADLDIVRMGVRDYDPKLSQFLTPDPVYLEDLDKCQASPLQCSLYGYASGNPVNFVDPTGAQAFQYSGSGQGQSPFDALFEFFAGAFVTNVENPRNYAGAVVAVAVVGTAGVILTTAPVLLSSYAGEGVAYTNFGLGLSGSAAGAGTVGADVAAATATEATAVAGTSSTAASGTSVAAAGGGTSATVGATGGSVGITVVASDSAGGAGVGARADQVASAVPPLRQDYVNAVNALANKVPGMRQGGMSSEQIARVLHAERRALGVQYKDLTPPAMLEQIYARNLEKYGDKLGPTIEYLVGRGKTWGQIIESATRTGGKDLGF